MKTKLSLAFTAGVLLSMLGVYGFVKYIARGIHHASIYGQNVMMSGAITSTQTFVAVVLFWPLFVAHDLNNWEPKAQWLLVNILQPLSNLRIAKYVKSQEEVNIVLNELGEKYFGDGDEEEEDEDEDV